MAGFLNLQNSRCSHSFWGLIFLFCLIKYTWFRHQFWFVFYSKFGARDVVLKICYLESQKKHLITFMLCYLCNSTCATCVWKLPCKLLDIISITKLVLFLTEKPTVLLQDMINSLGAYVQNVFVSLPAHEAAQQLQQLSTAPTSPTMLSGLPIGWYLPTGSSYSKCSSYQQLPPHLLCYHGFL